MRQTLATNKVLMEKLNELEKKLTQRMDVHERANVYVLEELKKLMEPPALPSPSRLLHGRRCQSERSRRLTKTLRKSPFGSAQGDKNGVMQQPARRRPIGFEQDEK